MKDEGRRFSILMDSVEARAASDRDLSAVERLFEKGFLVYRRLPRLDIREAVKNRFTALVTSDEQYLGAALSIWDEPPDMWLDGLAIAEIQDGEESIIVTNALLDALIEHGRTVKARRLLVSFDEGEFHPMMPVLQSAGFSQWTSFRRFGRNDIPVKDPAYPQLQAGFTVRNAAVEDVADLVALDRLCFGEPWRFAEREMGNAIRSNEHFDLVLVGGNVIAYLSGRSGGDRFGEDHVLYLTRVGVHPEFRGAGVAAHLLWRALAYAQRIGAQRVELRSEYGLEAAWKLIQRFGFQRMGPDRLVYALDIHVSVESRVSIRLGEEFGQAA